MSLGRRATCSARMTRMVGGFPLLEYNGLTIIVDICITTPMKALERVCILAKALADRELLMLHLELC
jgi:hypothetical protein